MPIRVTIQTDADLPTTWDRLNDFERWPEWNPACADIILSDPTVEVGTRVKMQLVHPRGRLFWTEPRITTIAPPNELSWTVRAFGVRAPLTIHCEALPSGGTAVTLTTHSRGVMGFAYRLVFPERTQGLLWSGALTGLADSFRTEPIAAASRSARRPPPR